MGPSAGAFSLRCRYLVAFQGSNGGAIAPKYSNCTRKRHLVKGNRHFRSKKRRCVAVRPIGDPGSFSLRCRYLVAFQGSNGGAIAPKYSNCTRKRHLSSRGTRPFPPPEAPMRCLCGPWTGAGSRGRKFGYLWRTRSSARRSFLVGRPVPLSRSNDGPTASLGGGGGL